ncbi:hypothetical protein NED98_00035 [Sphingomonas sp. MMSM20]|uniref:hypothetical protein n=1 Tax=Sphingomonas lycopersici TaxID=2951807 RepID=UPI0022383497|nr:hypothetical protein [Sphingomonas lycopersici]MCW6528617.1 hypothetical protein [Sphingomonas lycopersici]
MRRHPVGRKRCGTESKEKLGRRVVARDKCRGAVGIGTEARCRKVRSELIAQWLFDRRPMPIVMKQAADIVAGS